MTHIRHAHLTDLPAIEALRRADADALGFIPLPRYAMVITGQVPRGQPRRGRHEWLLVALDNQDVTGFCYASFARAVAKIHQVCVRADARRLTRAGRLVAAVDAEARRHRCTGIRCRVGSDLDATAFWHGIGWTCVGHQVSSFLNQRRAYAPRPLTVYEWRLQPDLFEPWAWQTGGQHR